MTTSGKAEVTFNTQLQEFLEYKSGTITTTTKKQKKCEIQAKSPNPYTPQTYILLVSQIWLLAQQNTCTKNQYKTQIKAMHNAKKKRIFLYNTNTQTTKVVINKNFGRFQINF